MQQNASPAASWTTVSCRPARIAHPTQPAQPALPSMYPSTHQRTTSNPRTYEPERRDDSAQAVYSDQYNYQAGYNVNYGNYK
jgi:hypothetical protein